jgi:nitrate/nitrite transport system substrate-binding protein
VATHVMRHDLYEAAMKEIGARHGGLDETPVTLFDGVTLDPRRPEDYVRAFRVSNLKS